LDLLTLVEAILEIRADPQAPGRSAEDDPHGRIKMAGVEFDERIEESKGGAS